MTRRKQPHPQQIESEDEIASWLENGGHSEARDVENVEDDGLCAYLGDEHICGKCRADFAELSDFLLHKKLCARKRLILLVASEEYTEAVQSSKKRELREIGLDKMDEEPHCDNRLEHAESLTMVRTKTNSVVESDQISRNTETGCNQDSALNLSYSKECTKRTLVTASVSVTSNLPQSHYTMLPDTHVALEALQNTRVAVAQHGHNSRVSELGALQTALYTLQQQQLLQLQIIQQLHAHILGNTPNNLGTPTTFPLSTLATSQPSSVIATTSLTTPPSGEGRLSFSSRTTSTSASQMVQKASTSVPVSRKKEDAVATSIASKVSEESSAQGSDVTTLALPPPPPPPPPPQEPNTLELLQRHTEQALQNTMSGGSFLLNGINGFGAGCDLKIKKKDGDGKEDTLFRHRCKFCGKVFGSDSALQIHLRSHTGERPFKCNVCGNRFSTKGNLKVHFQRHKAKYPHIKMNPHPVPEHLDSLHPPLEPPSSSLGPPISPNSSMMLMMSSSTFSNNSNASNPNLSSEMASDPEGSSTPLLAEDLSVKPLKSESPTEITVQCDPMEMHHHSRSPSPNEEASNLSAATETSADGSIIDDMDAEVKQEHDIDHDSMDSSIIEHHSLIDRDEDEDMIDEDDLHRDEGIQRSVSAEPYHNPSHRISTFSPFMHSTGHHIPSFLHSSPFSGALCMSPFTFSPLSTTAQIATSTTTTPGSNAEHNPNPAFYQDLLPKPGSADSSWESLMEVTKTSETSKLQQLVDNIEHKLSDPNQCIICHRVLSCKSALQMHYRTHTGERPFKCKICGRAFTTKGNLKTHMGVHRVKPPLRVLHQCPVCHKQFTNSLVLQQHIRMHTGIPSDILSDRILHGEMKHQSSLLPSSFTRPSIMPSLSQSHNSQAGILMSPPPPIINIPGHMRPVSHSPASISNHTPLSPDSVVRDTSSLSSAKDAPLNIEDVDAPPMSPSPSPSNASISPPPLTPVIEENLTPIIAPTTSTPISMMASTARDSPIRNLSPHFDRSHVGSMQHPTFTTSLAALENHVKTINTAIPQPLPFGPFGIALPVSGFPRYDDPSSFLNRNHHLELAMGRSKSPAQSSAYSSSPATSRAPSVGSVDERLTPASKPETPSSMAISMMVSSPSVISNTRMEGGALDLTPRASVLSGPSPTTSEMMAVSRIFPSPLGGLPFPPTPGRSNTTCQICFKTFACNSALEIHYRSHTKERPFKCHVCDRGFSTKGNMKQHMLTHKIRDLPSQLFTTTTTTTMTTPAQAIPTSADSRGSTNLDDSQNDSSSANNSIKEMESMKRHLPELNPLPKRPPGMPKHMCHVCNKPFSSGSALQIHMRTHTGDKPFKCSICGRAFTTKGNLKVHMGTHMWSNGSSRRGRRMSLELPPLPLPPGAKPGDIPHNRPDLYFQYFNPAFLNGMTPPKMNEISVIQTAGISNGTAVSLANSMGGNLLANHRHLMNSNNNNNNNNHSPSPLALDLPRVNSNGEFRLQEDDNKKPLSLSPRHGDSRISSSPLNSHHSPPVTQPTPTSIGPNWGWKIACNICSKICVSSTELEIHLKTHYKQDIIETEKTSQPTENFVA